MGKNAVNMRTNMELTLNSEIFCPFGCPPTVEVESLGTRVTLVGYSGKDPNHHTTSGKCTSCNQSFTKEWRISSNEIAYLDNDKRVLHGKPPSCCNTLYIYKCVCGGDKVHSRHRKWTGWVYDKSKERYIPRHAMFFKCQDCGLVEVDPKWGPEFSEGYVYVEPPDLKTS